MRRLWLLFALLILAGCRGSFESQVVGTWKVDPASVKASRLSAGAEAKPEWSSAVRTLGQVQIRFGEDGTASADGFGKTSTAKWKLRGTVILIEDAKETWPDMMFEPKGPRIHATYVSGTDTLQMDLIKS
jgi:hypothetical protein